MFAPIDISTSALVAQQTRLNAIAGNIANISTTHNEEGKAEPYHPRYVVFATDESVGTGYGAAGVKVSSVETENTKPEDWLWKFQPGHPDAVKEGERKGYVAYPKINVINEFVDSLEATRAYEANIGVIEVTKSMSQHTLRILA